MAALVTTQQVKARLTIDFEDTDPDLALMMQQATDIVIDYIKKPAHGWTPDTVPGVVQAAILLVLRALYDDEEKVISDAVERLLWRQRDPALA